MWQNDDILAQKNHFFDKIEKGTLYI